LVSLLAGEAVGFSGSPFGCRDATCSLAFEVRFVDEGIGVVFGETFSEVASMAEGDSEPFMIDC
jgi:hypothetical protein